MIRDTKAGPRLRPDDTVTFLSSHRPQLPDGNFHVVMRQTVATLGLDAQREFSFAVAGPRFQLAPDEIGAQFPPQGASGDFGAVLPHIALKRGTLPWERLATSERTVSGKPPNGSFSEPRNAPGWLALLVFDEEELAGAVSVVKAEALIAREGAAIAVADGAAWALLRGMAGDDPDMPVRVLDLPTSLAGSILPKTPDLAFLSSARQVNQDDPTAIVLANRLPRPDARNIVHLVSVEHQYRLIEGADRRHHWDTTHEHWSRIVSPGETIRLISLASWDFFCTRSKGDLVGIVESLAMGTLSHDPEGLGVATKAVVRGFTPVEHALADGRRKAAWYRGPLQTGVRESGSVLPVRRADALLEQDDDTGMADISHAAAWELGRLLALKNAMVAMHLGQWKRHVAHAAAEAAHLELADVLDHKPSSSPPVPEDVRSWFSGALGRLESVPFDYLVPDPGLLPPETIVRFSLASNWMAALFDGAFSIGRDSRRQHDADRALRSVLPAPARSGLLLRSKAVRGWPDLVVDGYAEGDPTLYHPVRYDRIGDDTLLVLFDIPLERAAIHLHPQAVHFGFDGTQETSLEKDGETLPINGGSRVLDLAGLAERLGAKGAHDFSFRMIERLPKFVYRFGGPHD